METLRGGYERYYEALAACLENGGAPPVDARDSRDGLIVIEAAQRSAADGQRLVLAALRDVDTGDFGAI